MDELRFVRREDQTLIVANDADQEFRLVVDDAVLSELRNLSRRERDASKVRPREIQSLIRAGKTRAQVMEITGLEASDIERYEEPVLAERRYILERAHAVPVRADAHSEADQHFGSVIAERLVSLAAEASEWASWRDEETGWMVSLEFISRDVAHRAVWAFDHRKGGLSPVTPDAVTLSKQGDVGDRLIPKLRAVGGNDGASKFDSGAFDAADLPEATDADGAAPAADPESAAGDTAGASAPTNTPIGVSGGASTTGSPDDDIEADYARRREIDQRAIKTHETQPIDLSQTADLLDALRRRRGERDEANRAAAQADVDSLEAALEAPVSQLTDGELDDRSQKLDSPAPARPAPAAEPKPSAPRSIWGASGVSGSAPPLRSAHDQPSAPSGSRAAGPSDADDDDNDTAPVVRGGRPALPSIGLAARPGADTNGARPEAEDRTPGRPNSDAEKGGRKGRASIPSWDDILFGTRSDEDPN
ncbi:septation protein SepH [Leucobacter chromiireducens]|uniref:septation protein SepH n=1 Tax=Leucobacter chromiireducens TaxID=283877 RepID=UPI003F7D9E5D